MEGKSPGQDVIARRHCITLHAGIDIGSTTVKLAVLHPESGELLFHGYKRHCAAQQHTALEMLHTCKRQFPDTPFSLAVCGSGGQPLAEGLRAYYVQEVVANSIVIRSRYTKTRSAIELGGQDAKVIFFTEDEVSRRLNAAEMRMNGSCAGGTGAFIDQIAELLDVSIENFNSLAAEGKHVFPISGRCGVFAKTDIQPLMNQGVPKEDIALSTFHAIARQTIGGLAQGLTFRPSVLFEGGPLTFNPVLIDVFREHLGLSESEIIVPENPELIIAIGAALSIDALFSDRPSSFDINALPPLGGPEASRFHNFDTGSELFFRNKREKEDFYAKYGAAAVTEYPLPAGGHISAYVGIDAGSTTTKCALVDTEGRVIDTFYANNNGAPLETLRSGLLHIREHFRREKTKLTILGAGVTGYGEQLVARGLHADYHTVETVAHAKAAQSFAPDASFILDIGGQDMKAISLQDGIITGIVMNEACSAGCGSFIETYAKSLGIPVTEIAEQAFEAENPSKLGSRCTVFMNSSIVTEQKNGKTTKDILAGICTSIIENVFTKVIRISNVSRLGSTVIAQGGTFKNDAVLRAFEQYVAKDNDVTIVRPPYPGEMGAIGIALLTKEHMEEEQKAGKAPVHSSFIGLDAMEDFAYTQQHGVICNGCSNSCKRTVITFNDGTHFVSGNRCERGDIPRDRGMTNPPPKRASDVPDLMRLKNKLLFQDFSPRQVSSRKNIRIGVPRVLEFWDSIPFWNAFFTSLGFEVVFSAVSSTGLFQKGLSSVPSDTVCFPAKLAHGHVRDLMEKQVDRIFMPMMVRMPKENKTAEGSHVCSVVQGYPLVIEKSISPGQSAGIPFDNPTFHWYNDTLKYRQCMNYFSETFQLSRFEIFRALKEGDKAQTAYSVSMHEHGTAVLKTLGKKYPFAVVLAGRPYHSDLLINHSISSIFTRQGIPVLVLDALPNIHKQDLSWVRIETTMPFNTRMIEGTFCVAKNPNLELVQIVSFGCGHDAILSDEMARILKETSDKELLTLKMDEGEVIGPLIIRINSFLETVKLKRKNRHSHLPHHPFRELKDSFTTKFRRNDKRTKTILAPNLSPAFSTMISAVLRNRGYNVYQMPLANREAIALGKQYVHNDICFPAQVNIGEALYNIRSGKFDPDKLALGLAKNCEDCRAGQYASIARKALDEAGYPQIPIMTTGMDTKEMHPGFQIGPVFNLHMVWSLLMMDGLEMMKRSIRPYEINPGETEKIFQKYLNSIAETVTRSRKRSLRLFEEAVAAFNDIDIQKGKKRPKIGIVGEILVNYHPVSNGNLEQYLELNGIEVRIPPMLDFFRRSFLIEKDKAKRNLLPNPGAAFLFSTISDAIIRNVKMKTDRILSAFRFYENYGTIHDLAENVRDLIDISFIVGEGWLIPAEIIQMIKKGINSFVIVQPFGCLPNHITGRGMIKAIKTLYPHVQILTLDFDPDTSYANIENRLQMLIMTAKELEKTHGPKYPKAS